MSFLRNLCRRKPVVGIYPEEERMGTMNYEPQAMNYLGAMSYEPSAIGYEL